MTFEQGRMGGWKDRKMGRMEGWKDGEDGRMEGQKDGYDSTEGRGRQMKAWVKHFKLWSRN